MASIAPLTVAQFKTAFPREFPFGTVASTSVIDSDVTRAIAEALMVWNDALWGSDAEKQVAFGYAAAHFLALNIQGAGGLKGAGAGLKSTGKGPILTKGVGPVNLGYALPDAFTQSPVLSMFLKTDFGVRYLQLLAPRAVGVCFSAGEVMDLPTIDATNTDPIILPTGNFLLTTGPYPVFYFYLVVDTSEPAARLLLQRGGRLRGLNLKCSANSLDGDTVFTLLVNGAPTTVTCILKAGILSVSDNSNYVIVYPNDAVSIKADISASTTGQLTSLYGSLVLA